MTDRDHPHPREARAWIPGMDSDGGHRHRQADVQGRRRAETPDRGVALLVLRILIAAALIVSAVIHFQLAAGFQQAAPDGIGGGILFRIQGAAAVLAALYVLVRGTHRSYLLAALVALASLAAVLAYRYIQIPTIGPIPSLYEPVWYTTKTITAVAEALALILALTAHALHRKSHRAVRTR